MATIYQINPITLELVSASKITEYTEIPGVVSITLYENIYDTDLNIFKHEYQNYDTFHSIGGIVESDIHYHDDEELRFIIQGSATFFIYHDNFLYVTDCYELELIKLQPNIIHWFSANNELLVYRFFKNNHSRIAFEPERLPDFLNTTKQYITDHGRRFEIR